MLNWFIYKVCQHQNILILKLVWNKSNLCTVNMNIVYPIIYSNYTIKWIKF